MYEVRAETDVTGTFPVGGRPLKKKKIVKGRPTKRSLKGIIGEKRLRRGQSRHQQSRACVWKQV